MKTNSNQHNMIILTDNNKFIMINSNNQWLMKTITNINNQIYMMTWTNNNNKFGNHNKNNIWIWENLNIIHKLGNYFNNRTSKMIVKEISNFIKISKKSHLLNKSIEHNKNNIWIWENLNIIHKLGNYFNNRTNKMIVKEISNFKKIIKKSHLLNKLIEFNQNI